MIGAIAGDIVKSRFEGMPFVPEGFELFHPQCVFTDDRICLLGVAYALSGDRDVEAKLRRRVQADLELSLKVDPSMGADQVSLREVKTLWNGHLR